MHLSLKMSDLIIEPHTEIMGGAFFKNPKEDQSGPKIFIQEGFTMNLTCVVKDSPEPPQYIFWYKNNQVRDYQSRK